MQIPHDSLAQMLIEAQARATPIPVIHRQEFTFDTAYAVQNAVRDEKIRRGARVLGKKIGLTSRAMRAQFNVDQPDYGNLFSDQYVLRGEALEASRFIAPKVEGEIAFIMRTALEGPCVTVADVLRAVEGVTACLEFVDSRWDFPMNVLDSIADNASCGGFALGNRLLRPDVLDLRREGMFVERNGALVASGTGVEALGDPLQAVVWLVNKLAAYGEGLAPGDIVLSGALTGATPASKGDVFHVSFTHLGEIGVHFV